MSVLFEWFKSFVLGINDVWTWLITPFQLTENINIAPIFMICGVMLIIGIVRAIVGII